MKTTPWIAAVVLTLGLTPAVRAQDWTYGDPASRWDTSQVSTLAHDIDETAAAIRHQADRNNRRPNREEARALADLRQLNMAAARFHRQVNSFNQDPGRTRADFAALVAAYDQTAESLRYIAPRPYIDDGMERMATEMRGIAQFYGSNYGERFSWDRQRRHDRYHGDHDRDDDHDHDRDNDNTYRPPL